MCRSTEETHSEEDEAEEGVERSPKQRQEITHAGDNLGENELCPES